jgi:glycosyltransferase involved in cell wall biosynthesis
MTVSAVLAAKDEEEMLEGCLRTLGFCDEIVVVVDEDTTDGTEEIARRYTENVFRAPFGDFSQIRNAGIERSTGAWILHVDADERITPELAGEIRAAVDRDGPEVAFRGPTVNFFWGRRMEHGGWGNMMQTRVMRREYARYSGGVHEDIEVPADRVGTLRGERWHFSHRSIEEGLVKTVRYGRLEAQDRFASGAPRVGIRHMLRAMALEFGRRMVRRTGWRDGKPGFIEAVFQPFARFSAEVMLWELQNAEEIRRRYEELEREVSQRTASSRSSAS